MKRPHEHVFTNQQKPMLDYIKTIYIVFMLVSRAFIFLNETSLFLNRQLNGAQKRK